MENPSTEVEKEVEDVPPPKRSSVKKFGKQNTKVYLRKK